MSCPPKSRESQSKCGLKTSHSIHYTIAQLVNFSIKKLNFSAASTDDGAAGHGVRVGRSGQSRGSPGGPTCSCWEETGVQTAGTRRRGREVPDTGVSDAQPGA